MERGKRRAKGEGRREKGEGRREKRDLLVGMSRLFRNVTQINYLEMSHN
jgi:hypothetical protein